MHSLLAPFVFPPRWMRLFAAFAFVTVAANLFWHGSQPYAVGLIQAPWDKLAHLVLYAGFCGAAWITLGGARPAADVLAPLAAIAIGLADEILQSFNPGRVVGIADLAADAVGALLAVALLGSLRARMRAHAPD